MVRPAVAVRSAQPGELPGPGLLFRCHSRPRRRADGISQGVCHADPGLCGLFEAGLEEPAAELSGLQATPGVDTSSTSSRRGITKVSRLPVVTPIVSLRRASGEQRLGLMIYTETS